MTAVTGSEVQPEGAKTPPREVVLADIAGFCFGVRRAVEKAADARARRSGPVTTLGPLVHNAQVGERLRRTGIDAAHAIDDVAGGAVVISAHGAAPIVLRTARERGLDIVDATCPFVTKVHQQAKLLVKAGYEIVLVGDAGHTEVTGITAAVEEAGGSIRLVGSAAEVAGLPLGQRVGVVSQTTQRSATFAAVVEEVRKRVGDVRAVNTVCGATDELQEAAARLARRVDVVIVVGGRQSANSRRLRDLCESAGTPAHQVESATDLDDAWFAGRRVIGLTAGASTPDWLIEEVARALNGGDLPPHWKVQHPDD